MTRIMYWNIEKFSINKIADPRMTVQPHTTYRRAFAANTRLNHIIDQIDQATPHIFSLVELSSGLTDRDRLVTGNGINAAVHLLAEIRHNIGDYWMMVPPLYTGPREGVAVYYDSRHLSFCGPHIWTGGDGPSMYDPMIPAVYGGALANALPARYIPDGAQNAGLPENTMAATATGYTFSDADGRAGLEVPFGWRYPYWTQFAELDGNGDYVRTIDVFSIHAPASAHIAGGYMDQISATHEIVDDFQDDEVRVVIGDFNVNLLNNDPPRTRNGHYTNMTTAPTNYTIGIDRLRAPPPPPAGMPGPEDGQSMYDGYYATHIKSWQGARYYSTLGYTQFYPGYGYIGSTRTANAYAIDNVFARYGGVNSGGPMQNVSIMNALTGSAYRPLGYYPPAALNAPLGNPAMPVQNETNNPPFDVAPDAAPAFQAGTLQNFRNWWNYGMIRSTSDHLPVVADI